MTAYGNGINAYRQTQVGTADPKRLVIMCYENVVKQLGIARDAYASGNYKAKARAVQNASDTVELLLQSLNLEQGDRIAANLQALYTYTLRRINEGDINKDPAVFTETAKMFEDLLESWRAVPLNPRDGDHAKTVAAEPAGNGGSAGASFSPGGA